jgi:hypothetical protein
MKMVFRRFVCRFLVLSLVVLPYAAQTQAALISVDQALAAQRQAERDKLHGFLARADVQRELAALGVGSAAATGRVNALTDDEAQQLAGRIGSLPAGAEVGTAVALLAILLLLLLIFMLDRRR